jgi:hypothetical protein
MQENHISRHLKSVLYCIFRDVSCDISMAVKSVNYFQKAVTQKKVSITVTGKNLKLGPWHTKITTLKC